MTANHSRHTAAAADGQGAAAEHAGTATTDPRRDTRSRWGRSSRPVSYTHLRAHET